MVKAPKSQINTKKSLNKKSSNKNISVNKSTSLLNNNNQKKNKSKNKTYNSNSKINSSKAKSKSKSKQFQNNSIEPTQNYNYNDYNNYSENINYNNFNENKNFYNNLDINNSLNSKSIIDNSSFKNSNYMTNNLFTESPIKSYNNNTSNGYIESSNIFKKTLDRLLITSKNLMEKQNNILYECDTLAKNVAMNDFAIQNLDKFETKSNFNNIMDNYTNKIIELFSHSKKNKTDFQINEELKKENNLLKNKLQMISIDREDNIKQKDSEISTLKIVLVSEINHIINFLNEIGYSNLPVNKMEISEVTSQKLTNFFNLIIKIIKQMKELIHKKESVISRMTIEQHTLSENKTERINNNKSYEKHTFDYNKYNMGLKKYNFSINNSNQKKKLNISFRNLNTPKSNNIINLNLDDNSSQPMTDLKINKYELKNYQLDEQKIEKNDNIINNKDNDNNDDGGDKGSDLNNEINVENKDNKDNRFNSGSFFYNKEIKDNNYSNDGEMNKSYQTGSFNFLPYMNLQKDENREEEKYFKENDNNIDINDIIIK